MGDAEKEAHSTAAATAEKALFGANRSQGQQKFQGQQKQQLQKAVSPKTDEKPLCKDCNRQHYGKCVWGTFKCFKCEYAHKAIDCPKLRQPVTGRAFVMHDEEAEPDTTLITGTLIISAFYIVFVVTRVLF